VFLDQSYSSNVHDAKSNLQKLIAKRPDNWFEIEKIIDENSREEPQTEDSVVEEVIDEPKCEWYQPSKDKDTIKDNSPFTEVFLTIEKETEVSNGKNIYLINDLYNTEFIQFLQSNFMPYIFIWAGFVFRGMSTKDKDGQTITHTTQGSIEKHFGTTKNALNHRAMYPAQYCEHAINQVIDECQVDKTVLKKKQLTVSNEQSDVNARDIFRRKAQVKATQNQIEILKTKAKKRIASSYQQPQNDILHQFDKKIKLGTVSQDNHTPNKDDDVKVDEEKTTAPVISKYYCVFCKVEFKAAANLRQHKSTNYHKENE